MKRFETIKSEEDLIRLCKEADEMCTQFPQDCTGCRFKNRFLNISCQVIYLMEELPTHTRVKNINSKEELERAYDEFLKECQTSGPCSECRFNETSNGCFVEYLGEDV